jgi:hypothetical protein
MKLIIIQFHSSQHLEDNLLRKINKLMQKSRQFGHTGQTSLEFSHQLSIFSIPDVLYDVMGSHFVQDRTPLRLDQTCAKNGVKID